MEGYLNSCRQYWTDWMRGQTAPTGWEDRHSINRDEWREKFLAIRKRLSNTEGHGVSLRSSLCLLH